MEMRLSQHRITEHIATVFDVTILKSMVHDIKESMAKKYEPTYRAILEQIAGGLVVHADETKGVVVWWRPLCLGICQSDLGRLTSIRHPVKRPR